MSKSFFISVFSICTLLAALSGCADDQSEKTKDGDSDASAQNEDSGLQNEDAGSQNEDAGVDSGTDPDDKTDFTGHYKGWLHFTLDNHDDYYNFTMELEQNGDKVTGKMVGGDSQNPSVVTISARVVAGQLDMGLDGIGKFEGSSSSDSNIYAATVQSLGKSLRLKCPGYTLKDSQEVRGTFDAIKLGTATIKGTIVIPENDKIEIHKIIDEKPWMAVLMFSLTDEQDGTSVNVEGTWNAADSSIDYTITDVPVGTFTPVFLTDSTGEGSNPRPGECFGVAGLTATQASQLLSGTTSVVAPTWTITGGETITVDPVNVVIIQP